MRAASVVRVLVLVAVVLSLSGAHIAHAACSAQITAIRVFDDPGTQQRALMEVDYSLAGSSGGIVLFVDGGAWDNGTVSGSGTFSRFVGPNLAQTTPGEHTYRATLNADCGAHAELSVVRTHEPRPTVVGTITGFSVDKRSMTVVVNYKFPYIGSDAGGRARVLQVIVDDRVFGESVLQPGDLWQGTKTFTVGGLGCLGTGNHLVWFTGFTSYQGSLPNEPSTLHIKQAEVTSFAVEPVDQAGNVQVTFGYRFEATQSDERRIDVFFNGNAVVGAGNLGVSGTTVLTFNPGCKPPGNYVISGRALACGQINNPLFRDERQTTLTIPVKKGNIDIDQLLDATTGDIKLGVTHTLAPGITSATRTVRVLALVGNDGIVVPGGVIRGPETITSSTAPHLEFAYTPPFWARTIKFQATLSFCNGQAEDVTTVECPNSCRAPQPPTASPGPLSYDDGNMRYSDGDPLPRLLDSFQLVRNYDSHQRVLGAFGRGWVSMFDNRLLVLSDAAGDTISLTDEQNESFMFLRRSGIYTQLWPKGRSSVGTLAFESATSLYLHRPAGAATVRLYRASDGRFAGYRQLGTGRELRITYDANGLPLSVTDSWTAVTWNVTVNSTTKRVTSIEAAGLTWQYQYTNDNLTAVLAPGSAQWRTYEYASDRMTAARDPLGNLIEGHTYDASGRAIAESSPGDEIESLQYGAAGTTSTQLVTRVTMKSGTTSEYTLQPIGGSWRTVEISGGCTSCGARDGVYAYDGDGHLTREQNANGYITVRTYLGERIASMQEHLRPAGCDPETSQTRCMLAPDTLKTSAFDTTSATITTSYEYGDSLWPDKPSAILRTSIGPIEEPRREELIYHPTSGEMVRHSITGWIPNERAPVIVTSIYGDASTVGDDRAPGTTDAFAPAFNPGGTFETAWLSLPQPRLRKSIDGPRMDVEDVTSYVYYPVDPSVTPATLRGRLAAVRNAAGQLTRYESYDAFGNPTRVVDANGVATEFTFDALGRLLTSTLKGLTGCDTTIDPLCASDLTTTRNYSPPAGPLQSEQRPAGGVTTYEYDDHGRVHALSRGPSAADPRERIEYTYDPLTGKKSKEELLARENNTWVGKKSESYSYDTLAQLRKVTHADLTFVEYTYDQDGRVAAIRDENHAAANTTYSYDPAGRMAAVKQTLAGAPGGVITTLYAYDIHGNLKTVTDPNGNVTSYSFDDLGGCS